MFYNYCLNIFLFLNNMMRDRDIDDDLSPQIERGNVDKSKIERGKAGNFNCKGSTPKERKYSH